MGSDVRETKELLTRTLQAEHGLTIDPEDIFFRIETRLVAADTFDAHEKAHADLKDINIRLKDEKE